MDDWLVIQRDMRVNAGIFPITEDLTCHRRSAASAGQGNAGGLSAAWALPPIRDDEIEAAALANDSDDMPERDLVADIAAAHALLEGPLTALDVVAGAGRKRVRPTSPPTSLPCSACASVGDYLQPAAVLDAGFRRRSAPSPTATTTSAPAPAIRLQGAQPGRRLSAIPRGSRPAAQMVPLTSGAAGVRLLPRWPGGLRQPDPRRGG
jgi:propanediol dehydratase large subunit